MSLNKWYASVPHTWKQSLLPTQCAVKNVNDFVNVYFFYKSSISTISFLKIVIIKTHSVNTFLIKIIQTALSSFVSIFPTLRSAYCAHEHFILKRTVAYSVRFVVFERFSTAYVLPVKFSRETRQKKMFETRNTSVNKIIICLSRQGDLWKCRILTRLTLISTKRPRKHGLRQKNKNRPALVQRSYMISRKILLVHITSFLTLTSLALVKCAPSARYWCIENPHYAVDKSIMCLFIFVLDRWNDSTDRKT